MIDPIANIRISVQGVSIHLPSQRATSLALEANELLQNALEHGMAGRTEGSITVTLADERNRLRLSVADDGYGLPADFNLETDLSLGLEIVRTSVTEDMQGKFYIGPVKRGTGTLVEVMVPLH